MQDFVEFNEKSRTDEISEEHLKQLIKIIKILQKFLNKICEKPQNGEGQKKIKNMTEQLEVFIRDNPIPTRERKPWWSRD